MDLSEKKRKCTVVTPPGSKKYRKSVDMNFDERSFPESDHNSDGNETNKTTSPFTEPNEPTCTLDERQPALNLQETRIQTIVDFKAEAGHYYYLLEFSDGTQNWTPATVITDSETLATCLAKLLEHKYGLQSLHPGIKYAKPFIPEEIIGVRGGKKRVHGEMEASRSKFLAYSVRN